MTQEKFNCAFISSIPWDWIAKIQAPIGGAAFRVALYIWFQKGVKGTSKNLTISSGKLNKFYKMDKRTFNRALHELESLEMIAVERQTGRSPRVTIIVY